MNDFFQDLDESREYKYRCLVYPNITFQKDFTKDSYYIIMSNILQYLTAMREDVDFTVLTPEIMPGFQYDNTEQVITEEVISVKREDGKFLFDKTWNYVAVIAKEVHDFHSLDKQKIFALHHPAIQEIDRQQQADKARIAELETKNQTLETKVQTM